MKVKPLKLDKIKSIAHFDRETVLAKVEDWLPSRAGVKILRIVNTNGGLAFVNDEQEQLKILFPSVHISPKDPRKVLGLILDRDKGWVVCSFSYSRDRAKSSTLTGILRQIGYDEDPGLLSTIYKVFVSAPQEQSPGELVDLIRLLVRVTKFNSPAQRAS